MLIKRPLIYSWSNLPEEITDTGQALSLRRLRQLPEWCGKPKTKDCCLNHEIGLPIHPLRGVTMQLTPYQTEFLNLTKRTTIGTKLYHINKGRQMGFTEIVLRKILYECLHAYEGRNVGIIAGTNGLLALENLKRLHNLCKKIPYIVRDYRKKVLELTNNTIIRAFPASEEAVTGHTNYGALFMDESAKWRMVDDDPVFNSVMPIVRTNGSDLFLVSTPKGPVKNFYKIHKNPKNFLKMKYDIWETLGNMHTREEIESLLKNSTEDPAQEYLCQFTLGRDSIFGLIDDKYRSDEVVEWDADDWDVML